MLAPDERRLWNYITAGAATLAVLKGLRLPNLWSATQLQLGYQFGFIKRGAAGALLRLCRIPVHHYSVFAAFSLLVLAATACALLLFVRQRASSEESVSYLPLFASSFAVTYLVHMVGYLDIILLLLTLLLLIAPRSSWWRPALDYIVCAAAMLVHEEFAITFFPVLWLYWLLPLMGPSAKRDRFAVANVIALPVFVCAAMWILALPQPMSEEQASRAQAVLVGAADFQLRSDLFGVMRRSLAANVRIMVKMFGTRDWWLDELGASLSLLWVAIFFTWRATRVVARKLVERRAIATCAVVSVCLSPMLMQIAGWDLYRWYAIAACTSFMAYLLGNLCAGGDAEAG